MRPCTWRAVADDFCRRRSGGENVSRRHPRESARRAPPARPVVVRRGQKARLHFQVAAGRSDRSERLAPRGQLIAQRLLAQRRLITRNFYFSFCLCSTTDSSTVSPHRPPLRRKSPPAAWWPCVQRPLNPRRVRWGPKLKNRRLPSVPAVRAWHMAPKTAPDMNVSVRISAAHHEPAGDSPCFLWSPPSAKRQAKKCLSRRNLWRYL